MKVALLGCGVVGSEVARLLHEQADDLAARVGRPGRAGRASPYAASASPRDVDLPEELFTTDAEALVTRDDIDVVVEVIGGIEPARSLILAALEHGASVVSANKALLAEDGSTLFEAAEKAGRDLFYEAAVAGAIPILRPLRESLAGDQVTRVLGIVNGTTNFILDRMDTSGAGLRRGARGGAGARVRRGRPDRRRRGLRRRRQGRDPGQPRLPHPGHRRRRAPRGHRRGHRERRRVRRARWAASSSCSRSARSRTVPTVRPSRRRVHPAMIPRTHPLASVREAFNAVFVESEAAGQLMFYGPGAGGAPTASAVMGDLVTVARNRLEGVRGAGESSYADLRGAPDGRDPDPLPRADRRRRQGRCARHRRPGLRRARRLHPDRAPGGARRRRPAGRRLAPRERRRPRPPPSRHLQRLANVREVSSVMRVEGESNERR